MRSNIPINLKGTVIKCHEKKLTMPGFFSDFSYNYLKICIYDFEYWLNGYYYKKKYVKIK